jgi:hypothetical protein
MSANDQEQYYQVLNDFESGKTSEPETLKTLIALDVDPYDAAEILLTCVRGSDCVEVEYHHSHHES